MLHTPAILHDCSHHRLPRKRRSITRSIRPLQFRPQMVALCSDRSLIGLSCISAIRLRPDVSSACTYGTRLGSAFPTFYILAATGVKSPGRRRPGPYLLMETVWTHHASHIRNTYRMRRVGSSAEAMCQD
ncbi:hypothetical protein OH76DRAFT_483650 [Lentinus brumalis]|uniref:Uncharacterized protein n=1 Tax=Lentinus brumalis TaxID=2498619 RepID=A0A371DC30_9APHY|nr:hypothetical protein OH76DRAFT_483650 [Polyporus brumalis]